MTFADSHPIACQWAGEILSALAALALFADAAQIFFARERTKAELASDRLSRRASRPLLGTIALVCAILYAIPQTAFSARS